MAIEEAIFLLFEEVQPALPEEAVMSSPEVVALKDTLDSSQELSQPFIFASRPITRLNFQLVPENEMQSVTCNEVHYTPKKQHDFLIYTDRYLGNICQDGY